MIHSAFQRAGILPLLVAVGLSMGSLSAEDAPPTITTPAAALPASVTATTTQLSVVGADDGGAATLVYAWSATGPAPVTFSATGTNAASTTKATFVAPGSYICTATVSDLVGQTVTSSVAIQVSSTLTTLRITRPKAVINPNQTMSLTGVAKDQFGNLLALPLTWTASGAGTVDANGLFTAGADPGGAIVTVATGSKKNTTPIRVNAAPHVVLSPIATPVASTTVTLAADGSDPDDASTDLTYTWSATGPASVAFAPNNSNASRQAVATVAAAGDYVITVTVRDRIGLTATASQTVSVQSVMHAVVVAPNATTTVVNPGATTAFTAAVKDQFAATLPGIPVIWSVDPANAGTISQAGLFTASEPVSARILASTGSLTGEAPVRVNAAPTVEFPALSTVAAQTALLVANGSDADDAASTLRYTWSATGPKAVTFSPNGTTVSAVSTATFAAVGSYTVTVTVRDPAGLSASAQQTVVVQAVPTSATLSPATAVLLTGQHTAFSLQVRDQFGAATAGTIASATAVGATAQVSGATCTVAAEPGRDSGSLTLTSDTVPPLSATAALSFIACEGAGTGLAGTYFDNEDFTGHTVQRLDPRLDFSLSDWPDGTAIEGIGAEWWSAIWTGFIDIPLVSRT